MKELKDVIGMLFDSIMNMQTMPEMALSHLFDGMHAPIAYKSGFRDARDAAAKIVADADAQSFVAVGRVERHTGALKDMSVIVWTGWQPAEGAILYTKREAALHFLPKPDEVEANYD